MDNLISDCKTKMAELEFPNNFAFDIDIDISTDELEKLRTALFPVEEGGQKGYVFMYDKGKLTIGLNWCGSCGGF